jgi:hypothetical protein
MYTETQVNKMVTSYEEGTTDIERRAIVDVLAVEIGKSSRSIIAKLVSLGVYIKKTRNTNTVSAMRKTEYVNAIRIMLGARDDQLKSLENSTKADLNIIMDQLKVLNNAS